MIQEEQQEELKRHEAALAGYSRRADLADRLVALRREGVAIRNRRLQKSSHPSIDGLTLVGWTPEVDAWERRVLDTIRGHVSAQDYGRFETLDTYTEKVFGWQIKIVRTREANFGQITAAIRRRSRTSAAMMTIDSSES